jgi:membrane-bound serine protease (ClpP class)
VRQLEWILGAVAMFAALALAVDSPSPSSAPLSASPEVKEVPAITLADSINPGTADYLMRAIQQASDDHAPYVLIQLDTPGGLLQSTRQIAQQMLNSNVPVVVYIGPRGAHAGSAGALITFAADVAVMAPGTNIGAAHPIVPGEKMDKVMEEKLANDTAAFAEGLAKSKGRNTEWAIKAVRQSASIIADEALKVGVIDFIADDLNDVVKKLSGFRLRVAKQGIDRLPTVESPPVVRQIPMSIKQRLVSFFSDPNLAYLILTLGGICIWVELSHPGMILPGIVGALCVILSLVSFQMLPIHYGALALIFLGMGLLLAELFLPTFGVVGIGGIVCFIMGSLFLMDTGVPEFQISLGIILPTAAALVVSAIALGFLVMRSRRLRLRSGVDALIGEYAEVREAVTQARGGKVFVHGELWNAVTPTGDSIPKGAVVVIKEIRQMQLVVEAAVSP